MRYLTLAALLLTVEVFGFTAAAHGGKVNESGGHCHTDPIGYHVKKDDPLNTERILDPEIAKTEWSCPRLSEDYDPEKIYWAQCLLSFLDHDPWNLDGIQGPATSSAIKRFKIAKAQASGVSTAEDQAYCVDDELISQLEAAVGDLGRLVGKCSKPPENPPCAPSP